MLGREKATNAYPSFVTISQDRINHPTCKDTDLASLRVMNSNFAVQPAWIKEAVTAAMPHTIQVGTYGLTEAAGTVSTSRLSDSYEQRTGRSEEHTSELQSLMRTSYAVFCLKQKTNI